MPAACSFIGITSALAAVDSFFRETSAAEKDEKSHEKTLRRNFSLSDTQFAVSFDASFPSDGGILGDKSVWGIFSQSDESIPLKQPNGKQDRKSTSTDDVICSSIDICLGVESEEEAYQTIRRRRYRTTSSNFVEPLPSRPSSEMSFSKLKRSKIARLPRNARPEHIVIYTPKRTPSENYELDVVWLRECVDAPTRLVRWSGSLEASSSTPIAAAQSEVSALTGCSDSVPSVIKSEVGWITCYSIQRGLTEMACAAAVDPVLLHFCKRFSLWAHKLDSLKGTIPADLENNELFAPYGSHAAELEMKKRVVHGGAPDGTVLNISEVLQGMPIFFISDLFIEPGYRGSGLGLVLLDRACRRVADSFCLIVIFLRDYTDERLPLYLGMLGFSFLAPGFLMRRHGHGEHPPRLEEVCPFLPTHLVSSSGGRLSGGNTEALHY